MAVDTQTYISYQKCFPNAQRQEILPKTPVIISHREHTASKVKEGRAPNGQVAPPIYQVTPGCAPNVQRPPRFQKLMHNVTPPVDTSLYYSPFPKQLGIPALPSNQEPVRPSSRPLLSHDNTQSLEPTLDIKLALRAQGIQIGIPPASFNTEPPTDLPIDKDTNHSPVQMPSLEHSQTPLTQEPSNNAVVGGVSPSTSRKDEMCRDWYIGRCYKTRCYFIHQVIPCKIICRFGERCPKLRCPFVHELQNIDGPVKNGTSNLADTQDMNQADSIRPIFPITSSVEFSTTRVPHPEVECNDTRSPPLVALPKTTPTLAENKTADKPQTTSPSTNVQHSGMQCYSTESSPSVASTNVTCVSMVDKVTEKSRPVSSNAPSSVVSSATKVQRAKHRHTKRSSSATSINATAGPAVDKVQPSSPVTSSSAASSATKVDVKSRGTGQPPMVASANTALLPATDDVRPPPSIVSSSTGSCATKVEKPEEKPHSKRRPPVVASANTALLPATDNIRPPPSVVSSSAGSCVTKVEKPEVKSRSTGRPHRAASTNATVLPAIHKVGVPSSVTSSSTVSSAVQVENPQAKPHDSGKSPNHPKASRSQKVCFDWLNNRCTRSRCSYLHERPSDDYVSETIHRDEDFVKAVTITESAGNKVPDRPSASQSQKVCFEWLQNRCMRSRCPYLHERPSHDDVSETMRRNEDFSIAVTIADHIIVRLRDGFEVQDVTTGFESRWVHVGDMSSQIKESKIRSLLEEFGALDKLIVPMVRDGKGTRMTIKAQYSTAAQALRASMDLHGRQFQGKKLTAKLPLNTVANRPTVLQDTNVRLTWRASQRLGYAGYATLDEAKAVIAAATGFVVKDHVLNAALYEGLPAVGAYNVMFFHLPADATRKDLEQFGNAESIMFERPNYQAPDSGCEAIHKQLRSCGNLSNFDVPLPIRYGIVSAWATFESHADASNARTQLDGQYPRAMGGKILIAARHVQTLSFRLPLAKYKMLEGDISRLRLSWRSRFYGVNLSDRLLSPDGPVIIKISAENVSNLGVAKAEFEQLQHGEVVTFEKKPIWDRFFSHPTGQSFLRELESRYHGIEIHTRMGKILLLGPIAKRQLARRDIMTRFQALQARQRWYIPLSGKVVGAFVSKDLLTLQKSVGAENCQILLSHEHTLLIRGNEQTYRIACDAVEKVQNRHAHRPTESGQSLCPVCFSEPSVPIRLTCGHSWCTSCLERYLVTAVENKTFPLTCLGNDASCNHRIPLLHAQKILSGDDFTSLCEASFFSYIHARTAEFHHCPTPDCAQVYRTTPGGAILQCPSCLVRICSMCHMKAHDGLSCEEREAAEDKLFHEWAAAHDVKNCPGCKTPIERSEGCNHMTCTRCQTHICWECLATFPRGDGIYQHMRYEHGGIGLEEL